MAATGAVDMSRYDPDERIHPPAPSFLSRRPTAGEKRQLRRVIAAMPPAPELLFWPESMAIDGPWGRPAVPEAPEVCRPHPPAPAGNVPVAPAAPAAPAGMRPVRPAVRAGNRRALPAVPAGHRPARRAVRVLSSRALRPVPAGKITGQPAVRK